MEEKTISFQDMKDCILQIVPKYPILRVLLFGSRAAGTNRPDSDIDLIMEFSECVSLLTLSRIRCELEEIFGLPVDVIHGPITKQDMIEIGQEVELYAA